MLEFHECKPVFPRPSGLECLCRGEQVGVYCFLAGGVWRGVCPVAGVEEVGRK